MLEQFPALDDFVEVPPAKIDDYRRDGHTVVRNICTADELSAYIGAIRETLDRHKKERLALADRDTYHKAFIQVANLWRLNETVRRFVLAQRFGKIAADLMGVDGVRLYHDQALFKEPGGGHTPWHQDQYYWPIEGPNAITMWMPFVRVGAERGAMVFASGYRESLVELGIGDDSAKWFAEFVRNEDLTLKTYELNAGDATFHSGWTPHKAPGNSTSEMRPVMTIIFVDADASVSQPTNANQPIDMEVFFPGLKPGDKIDTEMNPVIYHKDASRISFP